MSDSPAYVPLARKWRPRTFQDVVGQEEIVRALTNAVTADRLAHAYLFSGPRGVGKTTTARLLAAAINCNTSDRPTATPCGTCASCQEVLEGRSLDTLEIDGATHGKVDQARDLIEIVSYAPSRDRRKVFIIDEVHAISSAAFQALLKTLEEPPSHAVFILATTERHKIPATILSRCQRFDFRRLTDEEVTGRLADIAVREGFEVVDAGQESKGKKPAVELAALVALAAAATGSLRDGLSLFDQAAARSGGGVTSADVAALLGAPDRTALVTLFRAVLASDRVAVFKGCAELEAAGAEPRATLHDLTALVRGAVRLAADPKAPPPTGLSEEGAERVREFARTTPYATLLRLLALLSESDGTLRRSDVPALAFEVLLLKLAELPRLVPIEEFLGRMGTEGGGGGFSLKGERGPGAVSFAPSSHESAGGGPGGFSSKGNSTAERAEPTSRATGASSSATAFAAPLTLTAPVPSPSSPSKKSPGAAFASAKHESSSRAPARSEAENSSSDVPRFVGLTPLEIIPDPVATPDPAGAFRVAVEKKHSQLGAVLEDSLIRLEGKTVWISLDPPSVVTEKRLVEPAMAKVLEEAAVAVLGRGARVAVESVSPPAGDLTAAAANADPETLEREHLRMKVATDERVKRMMDLFGGEIADVKRDGGPDRAKGR
ncbi:MAG: DNA polymerase III subunit gamma/tau [Thermoanaerobaculia bacterium]|nr:DNA polymerase III subunit gamma/tau [Thermoanaerobaculia bacterium]